MKVAIAEAILLTVEANLWTVAASNSETTVVEIKCEQSSKK